MAVNGQTIEIGSNFLWFDLCTCNKLINETLKWCREGRYYKERERQIETEEDRPRQKEEGS